MKIKVTGGLFVYIAVLVLALLPAVLVNSVHGYLPFLILLMAGLFSIAQLLTVKNKLGVEAVMSGAGCTRGDVLKFIVRVENRSILPVPNLRAEFFVSNLDGSDDQLLPLYMTLSPREKRDFSFDCQFAHIGVYNAGIRSFEISDLFGFVKAVTVTDKDIAVNVLPRLYELERLPVATESQSESSHSVNPSPLGGMDYVGVREYAYGDPIKVIQWKLSAHAGTLMTKQTENYTNTGLSVVMDFAIPDGEGETKLGLLDAVIETAVASAQYARRNGLDYDIMFHAENGGKQRISSANFGDLSAFLPKMRMLSPGEDNGVSAILREDCSSVHGQNNIVVCTARLSEQMVSDLLFLRRCRKNPVLFYLIPENVYDAERRQLLAPLKRLGYANIPCAVASDALALIAGR